MSDVVGHIHLILPDPTERAACFRALTVSGGRVVRCFASADDWLEGEGDSGSAILLFRWHQPGRIGGAALLERFAGRADMAVFVAADQLSIAESGTILRGGARDLLPAPLDHALCAGSSMRRWATSMCDMRRWTGTATPKCGRRR